MGATRKNIITGISSKDQLKVMLKTLTLIARNIIINSKILQFSLGTHMLPII